MKKLLFVIAIAFFYMGITSVHASEVYYTNVNNISFTKEEYDFVSKILWDGYQENMTLEEYDIILSNGISENIQINKYLPIMPLDTSHTTNAKSLVIAKSAFPSYALITVTLRWLGDPATRSYDIMGAYLDGVSLASSVSTRLSSSSSAYNSTYIKSDSNGFGVSIKLPDYDSNIILTQSYRVNGTGNVFASYQHAKYSISLNNSQKYTISNNGSGKVFLFDSSG